jgi:hypothetical protein
MIGPLARAEIYLALGGGDRSRCIFCRRFRSDWGGAALGRFPSCLRHECRSAREQAYKAFRGWTCDGQAWRREMEGHRLEVVAEGPGYRVRIDGQPRTYHEDTQEARSKAVWLVQSGHATRTRFARALGELPPGTGAQRLPPCVCGHRLSGHRVGACRAIGCECQGFRLSRPLSGRAA